MSNQRCAVYFIEDGCGNVKIGHSAAPYRRILILETKHGLKMRMAHVAWMDRKDTALDVENDLHGRLCKHLVHGQGREWFKLQGSASAMRFSALVAGSRKRVARWNKARAARAAETAAAP